MQSRPFLDLHALQHGGGGGESGDKVTLTLDVERHRAPWTRSAKQRPREEVGSVTWHMYARRRSIRGYTPVLGYS
jgi:hypothetical protein